MNVKLDGKEASKEIYDRIKRGQKYSKENKILAIVTVGDDEASKVYVNNKKKKAVECGYKYMHIQMSGNTNFFELGNDLGGFGFVDSSLRSKNDRRSGLLEFFDVFNNAFHVNALFSLLIIKFILIYDNG